MSWNYRIAVRKTESMGIVTYQAGVIEMYSDNSYTTDFTLVGYGDNEEEAINDLKNTINNIMNDCGSDNNSVVRFDSNDNIIPSTNDKVILDRDDDFYDERYSDSSE